MPAKRSAKPWWLRPGPLLFLAGLAYFLALLVQDIFQLKYLAGEQQRLTHQVKKAQTTYEVLKKKQQQLRDPSYLEFLARDRLGYSYKGEVVYRALFPAKANKDENNRFGEEDPNLSKRK